MCKIAYEHGNIVGYELIDFQQIDHLKGSEKGLCIQISGEVAEALNAEMEKGRCNFSYLIEFVRQNLTSQWLEHEVVPKCRKRGFDGSGVTSTLCMRLPVRDSLANVGHIVGVYFDLEKNSHACCLLPDSTGTQALFFDPNKGFLLLKSKNGSALTVDDLKDYIEHIYKDNMDAFQGIGLRVGQYNTDPSWSFGSHGFRGRYFRNLGGVLELGEPVPEQHLPRRLV